MTPKTQEQNPLAATSKQAIQKEPQGRPLYGQQQGADEKKHVVKGSKVIVSSEIHAEIATLATHIQQLKERLLAQSPELCPTDSPSTSENNVEENPFPDWLN